MFREIAYKSQKIERGDEIKYVLIKSGMILTEKE